jgi:hypothetical protein
MGEGATVNKLIGDALLRLLWAGFVGRTGRQASDEK